MGRHERKGQVTDWTIRMRETYAGADERRHHAADDIATLTAGGHTRDIPDAGIAGLTWRVRVTQDHDTPAPQYSITITDEAPPFSGDLIASYWAGLWRFVNVTVTPVIGGTEYGTARYGQGPVMFGDLSQQGSLHSVDMDALISGSRRYVPGANGKTRADLYLAEPGIVPVLIGQATEALADAIMAQSREAIAIADAIMAGQCGRHGGPWGSDATCADCTTEDGEPRQRYGLRFGPADVLTCPHIPLADTETDGCHCGGKIRPGVSGGRECRDCHCISNDYDGAPYGEPNS
jgi:hypothetical protein